MEPRFAIPQTELVALIKKGVGPSADLSGVDLSNADLIGSGCVLWHPHG